jgi:hypothetical protein
MKIIYTTKQLEEITLLFDSRHGIGLLSTLSFSENTKPLGDVIDKQKLITFFVEGGYPGISKLIEVIYSPSDTPPPQELGSNVIDLYGVVSGPFSLEKARSLVSLKIGNRRKGITPLEWFSYLKDWFSNFSEIQKIGLNGVCEDLANLQKALSLCKEKEGHLEREQANIRNADAGVFPLDTLNPNIPVTLFK